MPRDGLRSIVYRSFVMCDDPKGVVESAKKMEHKNKGRVSSKVEREETVSNGAMEELLCSSSCQLVEVSRGAHKLNQVNNSWSRGGIWCDQHSEDIAKDLLKGALELQDSLHVLGKLQEASHLARLKKKGKERSDKGRNDQLIRRVNSSPIGERNSQKGIQNSHLSTGASSRDCIDELREVIRDSLARQNLLPNINAEEKRCFSSRYPDSASDIPSTSLSRSSSFQTDNFTSMDSSVCSAVDENKTRGPSLIAKLMGLEEMPSKSLQTHSQNVMEKNKTFSQQRPTFEIDTPKVWKSQFVLRTEDPDKTLKDVLETMHFKGLLKNNSIKEIKPDSYQSSDFFSGNRLINNSPPIVLIKPRRDPHLQPQEKFEPMFPEERSSNIETMLKKPKVKEDSPSKIFDPDNRGLNFSKMSRRVEAKETPVKRLIQQEGGKDGQYNGTRPVKIKQSLPTKLKSSGSLTQPSAKKVATAKNINVIPKPMISSRKPVVKEVAKAKNLSRSKDQAEVVPRKPSNPENASNVMKNKISSQPSPTTNSNSVRRPRNTVRAPIDVKKSSTKNAVSKPTGAKITTEKFECKGDKVVSEGKKINIVSENDTVLEEKRIDIASKDDIVLEEKRIDLASENDTVLDEKRIDLASNDGTVLEGYSTKTADHVPTKEETDHTDIQIEEQCCESSVYDVTPVTINDQNSRKSFRDDDDPITPVTINDQNSRQSFGDDDEPITPIGADNESFMTATGLKALLLSSPAFDNTRLSLDCANEIVQRKSHPDSQLIHHPWSSLVGNAKRHVSLDHLLKETREGVEALRSYSELADENYPTNGLYAMLERDRNHSEALSGIWDLGWKKGFSMDDTIQVAEDIEKQLLRGIIAEICA
ncbi:Dynein light chain type 1 family protein [Hibiscus syriacus]|uniref:Dynein light chain type 1 family protein n=1 Tax=Hibiscus syriacus TaxID=106335 RepID=A0A6A3D7P3_HIBSY|nr:Dynein light chain type 1 family protein [Hibiscus syriacus]